MLRINASDVAAAVGRNRYRTPEDTLAEYVARHSGRLRSHKRERDYAGVKQDTIRSLCGAAGTAFDPENPLRSAEKAVLKAGERAVGAGSTAEVEAQSGAAKALLKTVCITPAELRQLEKALDGHVNRRRGTRLEKDKTDKLAAAVKAKVGGRNSRLYTLEYPSFTIVGRVDGLYTDEADGSRVLVETKVRRNRLFGFIPPRERVQMEVYLRMTGADRAVLNQHHDEDSRALHYSKGTDEDWGRILERLEKFARLFTERIHASN